jgi:MFS family permease
LEKAARENAGRESKSMGKVAFASFIGTAIELYDFYIYGTAAALVLAGAFFARPVCGVVFGHFGGRVGRKALLIFSLLLMGVATFLIGLLPGYAAIGIWVLAMAAVSFVCISLLSENPDRGAPPRGGGPGACGQIQAST